MLKAFRNTPAGKLEQIGIDIHTFHPTVYKRDIMYPKWATWVGRKKSIKWGRPPKVGEVIKREEWGIFEKKNYFPN